MLKENQKNEIVKMLEEGYSQKEIIEETGFSRRTVCRIKKELVDTKPELAQSIDENKYNRFITKSEEKYLKKIEKERMLFEDRAEGWVYHLTKEELKQKQSGKWWMFIVYPESAEENWEERLANFHCQMAISPLHDKDLWSHDSPVVIDEETGEIIEEAGSRYRSGERKKAHWHVIIKFDKVIGFKEVNCLIRTITNGPYLQKCGSLKGAYEYFIHLNNPEKYQYEKDEIRLFNNFIIETTAADRVVLTNEISKVILEKEFSNMGELVEYYQDQYEYINVISLKSYYFEKLLQVNYRKMYPNGRTMKVHVENLKELHK